SFVGKNLVNRVLYILSCIYQLFGKGLSFTKRCTNEIPKPQTKHRRKGMFVKSPLFAQLKRSRVRLLHTVSAPTFNRPERVASRRLKQQLEFVAQHRVDDIGNLRQPLFQMTNCFFVRRTS